MGYISNFSINAGFDFSRNFYVTDSDSSPMNLTGATVKAYLAKHPRSIYATDSTSNHTYYKYIPFTCYVEDGIGGIISLNLEKSKTILLEEGKYVYSVSIIDINGTNLGEIFSGIVYVDWGMNPDFGTVGPKTEI